MDLRTVSLPAVKRRGIPIMRQVNVRRTFVIRHDTQLGPRTGRGTRNEANDPWTGRRPEQGRKGPGVGVREHEMTSEEAETAAAPAGEERQEQGAPRMPRLPLPGIPIGMPTGLPGRVLWWGGLAALAAFEVVDWPVAVLVGAGSWVAEQNAKAAAQSQRAEQRRAAPHTPSPA
jgi:hypothetical protein